MSAQTADDASQPVAVPPIVDQDQWEAALAELRAQGEGRDYRELDAIAAARRRLPMVELPDYTLEGADGPVRLVDVFDGKRQLIVYHHMWFPDEEWRCPGLHRIHQPVHPAASFSMATTPASSSSPRARSTKHSHSRAGGEQDDVVLLGAELLRCRHGRPARRRLPGERLPPRRRHRVPDVQRPAARHRATRSRFRPDRPAPLRTPGGVAASPEGWPPSPPTVGGPHRKRSPATPSPSDRRQLSAAGRRWRSRRRHG